MVVKVDMEKAYDKLNWSYLETVLKHKGFGQRWCKLISQCYRIVGIPLPLMEKGEASLNQHVAYDKATHLHLRYSSWLKTHIQNSSIGEEEENQAVQQQKFEHTSFSPNVCI